MPKFRAAMRPQVINILPEDAQKPPEFQPSVSEISPENDALKVEDDSSATHTIETSMHHEEKTDDNASNEGFVHNICLF